MPDLVVDGLTKQYETPGEPLVILRGVAIEMTRGQSMAIVGPSGSGKSTLLQIIGTLDKPTSGQVTIDDQDPFRLAEPQLAAFRSEKIGFVFQDHFLLPQLTALENVLVPTLARAGTSADVELDAHGQHLLDRVGLGDRTGHRPSELSGGERQRVAIARALVRRPLLLLADEPTGNLDPATAASVTDLLLDLQQDMQGSTMMIVVTHSGDLADRLQCRQRLIDGKLTREL